MQNMTKNDLKGTSLTAKLLPDNFASHIKSWGTSLGFQQIGITDIDLSAYQARYVAWLAQGFQGAMQYMTMTQHGNKRTEPARLIGETVRIISARMDYLPPNTQMQVVLKDRKKAYISRYALGRDYHKVMRARLRHLAMKIELEASRITGKSHSYRAFCDSAPVLEKPIAEKAGLGWIGKHTNLINARAGSWFFLGEIFTNIPLRVDAPQQRSHCGSCTACIQICPTQAIVAPYQLDARLCISYLTIELRDAIPIALRPLIGNRVYGCDDCQLICPWNKFAKFTDEKDFHPRHQLAYADLLRLFLWREDEFLRFTEGSAIRRIGYHSWLRNMAVGLGNAPFDAAIVTSLRKRLQDTNLNAMVREHVIWALEMQLGKTQKNV